MAGEWFVENEARIRKALESSAFATAGALNPEQLDAFFRIVTDNAVSLKSFRIEKMTTRQKQLDQLIIGRPVTRGIAENTDVTRDNAGNVITTYDQAPLFDRVTLNVASKKMVSFWPVTSEALQTSIEQGRKMEQTIMEVATMKYGDDMEHLAWRGDTTTYAAVNTPEGYLLRVTNGIGVLSQASHVLDVNGSSITSEIFSLALRRLPKHYLRRKDLKWWMSPSVVIDWQQELAIRQTAGGDTMNSNSFVGRPFGVPIFGMENQGGAVAWGVPYIDDNLAVAISTASSGYDISNRQGPYNLTALQTIILQLDATGVDSTTTIAATGLYSVSELADLINTQLVTTYGSALYQYVASDDGFNHLTLTSPTTGAASNVLVQAGTANTELGLTAGAHAGAAAGSGFAYDGTYMLLTPAANMIWGTYVGPAGGQGKDGVRVYSEFEPKNDRFELYIYTQNDVAIENPDAMVRVEAMRLATQSVP